MLLFSLPPAVGQLSPKLVVVASKSGDVACEHYGRIVAHNPDGGLLLEKNDGKLVAISAATVQSVTELDKEFRLLESEQLAAELLKDLGASFAIYRTAHFVVCSDASERYTEYCGKLLEHVHSEFVKFMDGSEIALNESPLSLPVIIFGRTAAFQEFAAQQHPESDFSDVPGYYSVRDNQMLIAGLSGDRSFRTNSDVLRELRKKPRQVETIVHEAVHQLAFNTGLQVRYADNPIWISEGLAVYFEQANGRGSLLWSRPGSRSEIHLPGFKSSVVNNSLRLPLSQLLSTDRSFQNAEHLADAYAEAWALAYYLIRTDRKAFDRLLKQIGTNKPLTPVSAEARLKQVVDATGKSIPELESQLIRYVSRLR